MQKSLRWYITACLLVFVASCVGGRTLYLDVRYHPDRTPESPFGSAPPLKVLLFPIEYRGAEGNVVGKWTGLRGKQDTIKTRRSVGEAVTGALNDYLVKAGFDVTKAPAGMEPEGFEAGVSGGGAPDVLISGSVPRFSARAESHVGFTRVVTEIKLKLKLRNVKDSSVVTSSILSTSEPRTVVVFDKNIFDSTVSESLSDALENVFVDIELREGVLRQSSGL